MEEYVIKDGKKLRLGYTTGSCAAAAAKAAAWMLLTGHEKRTIDLLTPKGVSLTLDVLEIMRTPDTVSCAIRKDSGDDPDVTRDTLVFATVRRAEALAAQLLKDTQEKPAKKAAGVDYLGECARHLEQVLGRKVRMTQGRKTGRIELEYYDADDREALLQALEAIGRRN